MEFIRVESVQSSQAVGEWVDSVRIFCVFEVSWDEYARIIEERNQRAENERQNEADRDRERQWYADHERELTE